MNKQDGVELSGEFSPFIRACIGIGILLVSASVPILAAASVLYVIFRYA